MKIEQLPTKIPQTASLPGVTWSFLWWARKVKDSPPLPSKPRLCSGIPSKKLLVKTFFWKRKGKIKKKRRRGLAKGWNFAFSFSVLQKDKFEVSPHSSFP